MDFKPTEWNMMAVDAFLLLCRFPSVTNSIESSVLWCIQSGWINHSFCSNTKNASGERFFIQHIERMEQNSEKKSGIWSREYVAFEKIGMWGMKIFISSNFSGITRMWAFHKISYHCWTKTCAWSIFGFFVDLEILIQIMIETKMIWKYLSSLHIMVKHSVEFVRSTKLRGRK